MGFFILSSAAGLAGILMMRCPFLLHWPSVACKDLSQKLFQLSNDIILKFIWRTVLDTLNKAMASHRIKRSTLFRLKLLAQSEYRLSDVMRESLSRDPLTPVLTEDHLQALDRRLGQVLRTVGKCVKKLGEPQVVITDFVESSRVTTSHPGGNNRWQNEKSEGLRRYQ